MGFLELPEQFITSKNKKMKINTLLLLLGFIFLTACHGKEEKAPTYNKGSLTIYTDASFLSMTQALADGYMIQYPEVKLSVKAQKEDLEFLDLLHGKAKIIVLGKELSRREKAEYERMTQLKFVPAPVAADGVAFIVPKDSPKNSISLDEIKQGLLSDAKPFIFDGANSSNLNFVAEKINEKPGNLKFSVLNGNDKVIEEIKKYPDKIGVIGYNTISRPYDPTSEKLRSMIKVLPIEVQEKSVDLNTQNLMTFKYPFTRVIYFLINDSGFNIASGFIRYSCTQIGQMVVQKEGLQPFNLYKREVQMN